MMLAKAFHQLHVWGFPRDTSEHVPLQEVAYSGRRVLDRTSLHSPSMT